MRIIILSDLVLPERGIGLNRYMGPYTVGTHLTDLGHDVVIFDWFLKHDNPFEIIETLVTDDTLYVAISTTFLSSREEGYFQDHLWASTKEELKAWFTKLRELLNRKCPTAKIVLGGGKTGGLFVKKEDYLQSVLTEVDYALIGTADDSVVDFTNDLVAGRPPMAQYRGGIGFIQPSVFGRNVNKCPEAKFQSNWAVRPNEALPIEVSRGCLYNCKFCHFDKKFSNRKIASELRDEFIRNYEMTGTTVYHFCDDCFNDTRPKVEEICNTILGLPFKIEWIGYARADLSIKFPDTMAAMMESGARGLFFGIETFNYAAGRAAGKGVHPDRVKEFLLDIYDKYYEQCLIECGFIVGLPHETVDSQMETIEWLNLNSPMDFLAMRHLSIYEYDSEMDETVIDYADYIRNPEKYGFTKIQFDPFYWEHATMNSKQAMELSQRGNRLWHGSRQNGIRMIWNYPWLRTLGYEWDQISVFARSPMRPPERASMTIAEQVWRRQYWRDLVHLNRRRKIHRD